MSYLTGSLNCRLSHNTGNYFPNRLSAYRATVYRRFTFGNCCHVEPDKVELVETRIIDGRKCLVIPMEDVEINGIRVRMGGENGDDSSIVAPGEDEESAGVL